MQARVKLNSLSIKHFNSPLIYLCVKKDKNQKENNENNGEMLYIGKSKNGITHPFNPYSNLNMNPNLAKAREEMDEMYLYICESEDEMDKLELALSAKYKPKYSSPRINNLRGQARKDINQVAEDFKLRLQSNKIADELLKMVEKQKLKNEE